MNTRFGMRYFVDGDNARHYRNRLIQRLNERNVAYLEDTHQGRRILLNNEGLPHLDVYRRHAIQPDLTMSAPGLSGADYYPFHLELKAKFFQLSDKALGQEVTRLYELHRKKVTFFDRVGIFFASLIGSAFD